MKRRDANIILVTLAAVGGGIASYSVPLDLLELGVVNVRIAELVPALMPPLGGAARVAFAMLCALAGAVVTAVLLPWKRRSRKGDLEADFSEFEMPAISYESVPVLRRADAHPDAPPRPPLVASRDLGGDTALPPADDDSAAGFSMRPADDVPVMHGGDVEGLAVPAAPSPLSWDILQPEMDRILTGVRFRSIEEGTKPENSDGRREPSLPELVERLERGLARRRAAGEGGNTLPASPGPDLPLASSKRDEFPDASVDLEAALVALKNITSRDR